jgi:hypothetical protein
MEIEKRRSLRIMFSIPVTVQGVDESGKSFQTTGRTITLSRHGACIQVSRPLKPGHTVRVINQANDKEAEFRVVGPISHPLDQVGEWGIECLHVDTDIWDIYFPPINDDADAHVLLSCRTCQSVALQSLSLMELEVLETAGLLTKPCAHCGESTAWGYSKRAFDLETMTFQAGVSEATGGFPILTEERRKSQRKPARLPVRVRDYYGELEVAQTENFSQEGFCFSGRRQYLVGQSVVVICPFDEANERMEVRGRIVRIGAGSDQDRFVYAVRYQHAPH